MKDLRSTPPKTINGSKLLKLMDYEAQTSKNIQTGEVTKMNFPKENVLQFLTEDGTLISARPSGTEPKIKFYFSVNEKLSKREDFDKVNEMLDKKVDGIIAEMKLK
jgi:phosphoglucomutase